MRPQFRFPFRVGVSALLVSVVSIGAGAQTGPAPEGKKPTPNKYGSPLDTLMSTHLWTEVPAARPFVKETHPDPRTLDYTPLNGKDPDRPKPRDAANVQALQAELEQDAGRNAKKARGLSEPAVPARVKRRAKVSRSAEE